MDCVFNEVLETSTSSKIFDPTKKLSKKLESNKPYCPFVVKKKYKPVVGKKYKLVVGKKYKPLEYKVDTKELVSRSVQYEHELFDENFILEKKENKIVLSHKYWSLYAEGENLLDAESNLIHEAKELADVFLKIPASSLDINALRLREFLYNII